MLLPLKGQGIEEADLEDPGWVENKIHVTWIFVPHDHHRTPTRSFMTCYGINGEGAIGSSFLSCQASTVMDVVNSIVGVGI